MNNAERIKNLKEKEYQKLFGILKPTFEKILSILESAYKEEHAQGGRPPKLSVLDRLVITLGYLREYRTMEHIAFDYGVAKSTVSDVIKWVEETVILDGTFALPPKRELKEAGTEVEIAVADVTECETERPQKNSRSPTQASKNAIQSKT
jgi:transcriptional antiterminator